MTALYDELRRSGLPAELTDPGCDLERLRRSGDLALALMFAAAERVVGGTLPDELLESVSTLADLDGFVEVRTA